MAAAVVLLLLVAVLSSEMEVSCDIVSREASSVEDPEGVGDDPGVGHEPGVDPEVEDGLMVFVEFVVTFVLLLKLHVEFLFELLF